MKAHQILLSLTAIAAVGCASVESRKVFRMDGIPTGPTPKRLWASYGKPFMRGPAIPVMTVTKSSHDVIEIVKSKYPEYFSDNRITISLFSETLILSGDQYFREVAVNVHNPSLQTPHGECSQLVYVWFNPHGEVAGVYPEVVVCAT